jgi:hypothetical protein
LQARIEILEIVQLPAPSLGIPCVNNLTPMKATITSLITAGLLGFAATLSSRPFDAGDFLAIAFVAGLVAWTVDQYSHKEIDTRSRGKLVAFEASPVPVRANSRSSDRIAA